MAGLPVSSSHDPAAKVLRRILERPGVQLGPACFDALSAKLIEGAGFSYCFTSGFSICASRLGLPDTGLISYGEMFDHGLLLTQAVSIPIIADADNGFGNPINVKRTVKGFIQAAFAGIFLEDQLSPKACGHTPWRKVLSRQQALINIKAAVDARSESGSDIVIIAHTDARQAVSLHEALLRVEAFADAGADVLFIDALASVEEMRAFCQVSPHIPKMANMLEGGGKTPILTPQQLEDIGYKIVVYPLSLIGVSIRAMQNALTALKQGVVPPPGTMPSFEEIKDIVGFNTYYQEEKRYAIGASSEGDISRDPSSGVRPQTLRVKVAGKDGFEKLDLRIPAGSLDGLTNIVPALAGINIKELMDNEVEEIGGKKLLDFSDSMDERIQVFLE
ncbi:hypothetical protein PIB30_003370 [Stylosanthes scabra]|uniref:Isocitrate lyase n=1 Tax=Stylosanthes scabra TaxID=79078 RepID=A0ABU6T2Z1_9FABA|nr:hypothetical protein [Stylosanthes scabra]